MREVVAANQPFEVGEMTREEARAHWEKLGEKYKLHFLSQIPAGAKVTTYRNGPFLDLCRGPHLRTTGELKAFKLTHVAGAYWLGSAEKAELQGISGTPARSRHSSSRPWPAPTGSGARRTRCSSASTAPRSRPRASSKNT